MTDTQFAALLRPMMPRIVASVRARLESERTTTFADESDDSPQFRPAFGPDDAASYSDYFADDNGCYPHTLHRHFGMSVRDFADATKLVRKSSVGPDGKLVWTWVKRPAAQPQPDDNADVEMFSLEQVNEFSDRKEGERWVTNGRHYKREGGRTVRYSPEKDNGGGTVATPPPKKEVKPAKQPEPLSAEISKHLRAYTDADSGLYRRVNARLRGATEFHPGEGASRALTAKEKSEADRTIAAIDKAFETSATRFGPDTILHRGESHTPEEAAAILAAAQKAMKSGEPVTRLGFTSTSRDPDVADSFVSDLDGAGRTSGVVYRIRPHEGLDLAKVSAAGKATGTEESEVLLNHNSKFRVTGVTPPKKVTDRYTKPAVIELEQLPATGVPEPTAAPQPAAPSKPTKADVRSRLDAAFADPSKLTAEHFASLKDDLLATHTGDELRAIAEERKTRLTGTKSVRVQALIDAAKAKVKASGGEEQSPASAPVEEPTDSPSSRAKQAKAKLDAILSHVQPLTDEYNRLPAGKERAQLGEQLDQFEPRIQELKKELADAHDTLAAHNGHDYGVYTVGGPGQQPQLVSKHPALDAANAGHKRAVGDLIRDDSRTDHGRDIKDEHGVKTGAWHTKGAGGKEVYVAKVPRGKVQPESPPAEVPPPSPAPAPHSQARAALDALGLAHSHLSDDDVMQRLRAAFAPPAAEPASKGKPQSQPKPSPKKPKATADAKPDSSTGKPGHDKVTALQSELTDLAHTNPASAPTRDQIYDRVAKALEDHDPREVAKLSGYPAGVIGNKANALKLIQNSIADTVGAVKRVAGDRILAEQQAKELAAKEERRREKAKAKKAAAAGGKSDTKGGK